MKYDALHSVNVNLPSLLKFGTSSWTYPGWKSLLYFDQYSSEAHFKKECLREYARCPLFQTLGLDSSFYGPPSVATLQRYHEQLPPSFPFLIKAWEEITIPQFPNIKRYGKKAGKKNERFLSPELLKEFLTPFQRADFTEHIGVVVFQFQRLQDETPEWFLDRLEEFLHCLPPSPRFATEVRSPELLNHRYFSILNAAGATHCFTHWTAMPPLAEQMKRAAEAGGLSAPFFAARLLTPLGVSYAEAVCRHQPYAQLRTIQPSMRQDVIRLAKRALEREVPAYIIVNNRLEGCAPKTIDALRIQLSEVLA